jgi:hypothetical protein
MFARGWACLHTAQLPVPKNPAAKPCVSITSKLIESKRLQVLYFGHLRKTGGRGSYRLVHTRRSSGVGLYVLPRSLTLEKHKGAAPKSLEVNLKAPSFIPLIENQYPSAWLALYGFRLYT